jgi:hypothetical protein
VWCPGAAAWWRSADEEAPPIDVWIQRLSRVEEFRAWLSVICKFSSIFNKMFSRGQPLLFHRKKRVEGGKRIEHCHFVEGLRKNIGKKGLLGLFFLPNTLYHWFQRKED